MIAKIVWIVCVFVSCSATAQNFASQDSTLLPALGDQGLRNSTRTFLAFSAKDINGKIYNNEVFCNKITFVNFWFEGCLPCMAEMATLNELYNKYRRLDSFRFISLTFESPEVIRRIAGKYNISYPVLMVAEKDLHVLNFGLGFPVSMIIDRKGQVSFAKAGGFSQEGKATEYIRSHYYNELNRMLQLP